MDQKKIGAFLKNLRNEKNLTQEQLAEMLGVTNRSISRWENGINMPDFDFIIEMAKYYDVSITEILNGEREKEMVDKKTEETLLKAAECANTEKNRFSKRICILFITATILFVVYCVLEFMGLTEEGIYEDIATFALGIVFGTLLVGTLYTSRYMAKIQKFKMRLFYRNQKDDSANDKNPNA